MATEISSFLGANTPNGFVSLFGELYDPYRNHNTQIIKGGPGCGKSTLMKRIADRGVSLGFDTERIYCSSDPDSLDAVSIPALSLFVCDGTAPHVVEPRFPGACENMINLGAFWNQRILHERADQIRKYTLENALLHRRSTRYLAAAGALRLASLQLLSPYVLDETLNGYALRFCMRLLPRKKGAAPGRTARRFLTGITPKGRLFFDETIRRQATEIVRIVDPFSPVAGMLLQRMAARAVAHGYDVLLVCDPLEPHGDPLGLLIPEPAVALLRVTEETAALPAARNIHAARFLQPGAMQSHRQRLLFQQKTQNALLDESVATLRRAKETHDLLENCYRDAIDFDAMNAYTEPLIARIFQEQLSLHG